MSETKQQPVTALQDLIAGGIAGSTSVCVGHPFDTYKVMLQTSSTGKPASGSGSGSKTSLLSIMKLYRGMGAPLSAAAVVNALIFSSFGESSRLWDDYFFPDDGHLQSIKDVPNDVHKDEQAQYEAPDHSSVQKSFVCGSFAGGVQAIVTCPTEHVKCRLQIQNSPHYKEKMTFRGPFDALHKIVSGHGVQGLYRGFAVTAWRELPAFGLYFAAYDCIKDSVSNVLSSRGGLLGKNDDSNLHLWAASSLGGGLSGALTWAIIYPFDVIKTRIQTSPLDTPLEERRISFVFRHILQENGWRFFFRGLGVTLLRAFPVNAIIFPVYEVTLEYLSDSGIGASAN